MFANITLITLCVADIAEATHFYESLGFVKSNRASQAEVSFLDAGGIVLALWEPGGADRGRKRRRAVERQWRHRRCAKCRKRG